MDIELLKRFCSTDPSRPTLHNPFSQGEFTYGCDGRIGARVARLPEAAEQDAPKMSAVFDPPFRRAVDWVPLASIYEGECVLVNCHMCGGSGTTQEEVTCEKCLGSGLCTCEECGTAHDCGARKGDGSVLSGEKIACDGCDGKKQFAVYAVYEIKNVRYGITESYLTQMSALPGCEIGMERPFADVTAIAFRFDGGHGVIMPYRMRRD